MQLISAHHGQLQRLSALESRSGRLRGFSTGLAALDGLLPAGGFARGAVHEILWPVGTGTPMFFALLLTRAAGGGESFVVWCDPEHRVYPPALAAAGLALDRVLLLRPKVEEMVWAVAECLRCKGVAATVAPFGRLSRLEVRRLQLAAEAGGGVGLLLRPMKLAGQYAAATRWVVRPARGERTVQRWKVELVHGHGGRTGQSVVLEACRETNRVCAVAKLADRPATAQTSRATA